jgi:hypothetical protein
VIHLTVTTEGQCIHSPVKSDRSGLNACGPRYTWVSIPGTGLRCYKSGWKASTGCLVVLVAAAASVGGALWCLAFLL